MAYAREVDPPRTVPVYVPVRLKPWPLIYSAALGALARFLLPLAGIETGPKGIELYARAHEAAFNRWVHTITMPFVVYGVLLWVPDTVSLPLTHRRAYCQIGAYIGYIAHYVTIDSRVAFAAALCYALPLALAVSSPHGMFRGMAFFVAGLLVQQCLGHWLSGDPSSAGDSVGAAIYAPYFEISHVLRCLD